jgi:hypothetical protein
MDGDEPFEYAVRMARFDRERELDKLLARNALPLDWMDELAECVAEFHGRIPCADVNSDFGTPAAVYAPMDQNFEQLRPLLKDRSRLEQLERIATWTRESWTALQSTLIDRHAGGFVRECHGDMHLGNMAHVEGRVLVFDAIEFSETLRWIDVMSEIAFVTMDLMDRGAPAHANRFLNAWLERSGDYDGLDLLPFYQVYRAMVRAKVAGIRLGQQGLDDAASQGCEIALSRLPGSRRTPDAIGSAGAVDQSRFVRLRKDHGKPATGGTDWSDSYPLGRGAQAACGYGSARKGPGGHRQRNLFRRNGRAHIRAPGGVGEQDHQRRLLRDRGCHLSSACAEGIGLRPSPGSWMCLFMSFTIRPRRRYCASASNFAWRRIGMPPTRGSRCWSISWRVLSPPDRTSRWW